MPQRESAWTRHEKAWSEVYVLSHPDRALNEKLISALKQKKSKNKKKKTKQTQYRQYFHYQYHHTDHRRRHHNH